MPDYIIPDIFYRYLPDSKQEFSTNPAGGNRLNLSRAAQLHADCWEKTSYSRRKVPKTLILADYRLQIMSLKEINLLQNCLKLLLTEGFPILLWIDDDLPLWLNNNNLYLLNDRKLLTKVGEPNNDKVKEKAEHYLGLSAEQILVLNNKEVIKLTVQENIESDGRVPFQYSASLANLNLSVMQADLSNADSLELQGECNLVPAIALPKLKYLDITNGINLTANQLAQLTESPHLEQLRLDLASPLDLRQQQFKENQFSELQFLEVNQDCPGIEQIINRTTHLKHLSLVSKDRLEFSKDLTALESLDWHFDGDEPDSPGSIDCSPLSIAANLKRLRISGENVSLLVHYEMLANYFPTKLEELYLEIGSDTVQPDVIKLLHQNPLLKKFSFKNYNIESYGYTNLGAFPEMEDLHISHSWDANPFLNILLSFPNLKKLHLSLGEPPEYSFNIGWFLKLKNKQLEMLALSGGYKSRVLEKVREVIDEVTQLKVLDLRYCTLTSEELQQLSFPPHLIVYLPDPALQKIYYPELAISTQNGQDASSSCPTQGQTTEPSKYIDNHTLNQFLSINPPDRNEEFSYEPKKNSSLDQIMLINQLSQYLTLTRQHRPMIYRLQPGICNALSRYFMNKEKWNTFLYKVKTWNGRLSELSTELHNEFNLLYQMVEQYQFSLGKPSLPQFFLGENLRDFLATNQDDYVFKNPWHAIAIKSEGPGQWVFYNPNDGVGAREINSINELQAAITLALGELVMVEQINPPYQAPQVNDLNTFVSKGGILIWLNDLAQWQRDQTNVIHHIFSETALSGLVIRDLDGRPAWYMGLRDPKLQTHTKSWLIQWLQNPVNHLLFSQSMEHLQGAERQECQTLLANLTPGPELVAQLIRNAPKPTNPYLSQFKTWEAAELPISVAAAWAEHCLAKDGVSRRLIPLQNENSTKDMAFFLQSHCHKIQRPVFYVHSPDDLICNSPWIERHGKQGLIRPGPGGPLYDFLQTYEKHDPVIIINYDNFHSDDLVRFNALLDKEAKADLTPLPAGTQVIGLMNINNPDCYQGTDFYSRFQKMESPSLSQEAFKDATPLLEAEPIELTDLDGRSELIQLFHASDWKDRLLGRWVLEGKNLFFQEGLLAASLKKSKHLVIAQGLWDLPAFCQFWQQALLDGKIRYQGQEIQIPSDLKLSRIDNYDWSQLKTCITPGSSSAAATQILNPGCLGNYLGHQRFIGSEPVYDEGLIKKNQGGMLSVYLTREMNENEWAALLGECQTHQVQLGIQCASGVSLLKVLNKRIHPGKSEKTLWNKQLASTITQINSSDPDTTIAQISQSGEWLLIDVSECDASTLLERVDVDMNRETLEFNFLVQTGALRELLNQGKHIILRGQFSENFQDLLAEILLNYQGPGQIVLVGQDEISYLPTYSHEVTANEKLEHLAATDHDQLAPYLDEPLAKLKARSRYLARNPEGDSNEAFCGILTPPPIEPLPAWNEATSAEEAQAFFQAYREEVALILDHSPIVYLAGLSGVGKSTFACKEYQQPGHHFFQTEKQLYAWATCRKPGPKRLFIDEANIGKTNWTIFEGLFANPPGIFLNGEFIPLTKEHQVIFAANPISYGDERHLASLFARHGNSLVFKPFPPAVIYEHILKPVLEYPEAAKPLIDIYSFMAAQSETDVLITPRELEMMALMINSRLKEQPHLDPLSVANHYAWLLSKNLVPKKAETAFNQRFKPEQPLPSRPLPKPDNYLVTDSRQAVFEYLHELIKLRQYRQTATTEVKRYGGLGGMVIEGPSGIGKSELVIASLVSHGFVEVHDYQQPFPDNAFIRMPASLSLEEKKALLLNAFDAGAIVIADEVNSSPMMEAFLNTLLMGRKPDGSRPAKPGFFLIGTQNPVTEGGRLETSSALLHRMFSVNLPDYPKQEMMDILAFKDVRPEDQCLMIEAYQAQWQTAVRNRKTPRPGFRNLIDCAENAVRAYEPVSQPHHLIVNSESESESVEPDLEVKPLCLVHHRYACGAKRHTRFFQLFRQDEYNQEIKVCDKLILTSQTGLSGDALKREILDAIENAINGLLNDDGIDDKNKAIVQFEQALKESPAWDILNHAQGLSTLLVSQQTRPGVIRKKTDSVIAFEDLFRQASEIVAPGRMALR